jgi:cytochrome c
MRQFIRLFPVILIALAPSFALADASHGTAEEAKAMADRAAAMLKSEGSEKTFAAINDPANKDFHDRDLYVFVRSMDGNTVAHGVNKGMIGHTSLDLANAKGSGWVDYRWPNPVDKKIEPKSSYIEKVGDYVVGVGVYKQ